MVVGVHLPSQRQGLHLRVSVKIMLKLLRPVVRNITEDAVIRWAVFEWCNNAPAYHCPECGEMFGAHATPCGCDTSPDPVYPDGETPPETLSESIAYLEKHTKAEFGELPN